MDLQVLWFCLIAFFFGGYFVLEGFDLGVGLLLPFLARNEEERSTMFRTNVRVGENTAIRELKFA